MEKIITYCGQTAKVACDEKCNKAWGNKRPRVFLDINETEIFTSFDPDIDGVDPDNFAYCSDDELGDAPINPGTYEGFEDAAKPSNKEEIGNKWCVRELRTMRDVKSR